MFVNPKLAKEIITNPFRLIDLSKIPDEELMKAPFAGFMQMLLKHTAKRDIIDLIRKLSKMIKTLEESNQLDLLEAGVYYLVATGKNIIPLDEVFHEFQKHITLPTQEHVITIAEALIQEGRQEGELSLLLKQLKRRFGIKAVEPYLKRIHQANCDQLSQWGENFVDAANLEDIFLITPR